MGAVAAVAGDTRAQVFLVYEAATMLLALVDPAAELIRPDGPMTGSLTHPSNLTSLPFFSKWLVAKSGFEMCFGPCTLGAGAKTCLESRIKKFTPHCICRPSIELNFMDVTFSSAQGVMLFLCFAVEDMLWYPLTSRIAGLVRRSRKMLYVILSHMYNRAI